MSPCYSEPMAGSERWRKREVISSPAAGEAVHAVSPLPEQDTEEEEEDGHRMSVWG